MTAPLSSRAGAASAAVALAALLLLPARLRLASAFGLGAPQLVLGARRPTSRARCRLLLAEQVLRRAPPALRSTAVGAEEVTNAGSSPPSQLVERFLARYEANLDEGRRWAEEFGFVDDDEEAEDARCAEGSFYAAFRALRDLDSDGGEGEKVLGLSGRPFRVPASLLARAEGSSANDFAGCFRFRPHLAAALEEDFLDAQVGSTDNRRGWTVREVSSPTGTSFEDARMTLAQVESALESGSVIFNNIGAHIPRLAGPTLASTDALSLPGAVNLYVTARGMRTSAPPHTDRQDVLVVQTAGAKRWRVFSPPADGPVKPSADPFARGKGEDSLPLHALLEGTEGRLGSEVLMDVVTREGDVLFIPAGFPHTTDTAEEEAVGAEYDASVHLTFNVETHVWNLDNLNVRSAALRRSGARDILAPPAISPSGAEVNRYTGNVNQLPANLRSRLMDALPLEFLDAAPNENQALVDSVVNRLDELCSAVNDATGEKATVLPTTLREALARVHSYGMSILDVHRDMYLAAVEEGRLRKAEAAMTAHIKDSTSASKAAMTPERMQRLSLFRVRPFFEQIDAAKKEFEQGCVSGSESAPTPIDSSGKYTQSLDPNWPLTAPLKVGDEVEADLGGAFFAAKVSQVVGNRYNVVFFDGDRADGLERNQIKLLNPPSSDNIDDIDTTGLTKKEIKRLRKKMEKKQR
ncbi:hypothetical protein ACHAWF_015849 [Thalassiosira exigua]